MQDSRTVLSGRFRFCPVEVEKHTLITSAHFLLVSGLSSAANSAMPCHKEFENAGKVPGLQVWRIEKMEPKLVPNEQHGDFYMGDAYIVLYSYPPSYKVHTWHGKDCSMDESGAAAILTIQLDEHLGGSPVQYRECQGEESCAFQGYFRSGIKYMKGGVASGFRTVRPNEQKGKRLFHVKGRRCPRGTEVGFAWCSFNSGDCFILDLGEFIYNWCGKDCNRFEIIKALQMAIDIRDNEYSGRSKVEIVEEGCEPQVFIDVLGTKPTISPASSDDADADRSAAKKASLYMISDATGSMKATLEAENLPFKQEMLNPSECYILDNGLNHKVFVWKGPKANKDERRAAMKAAIYFLKQKNYCPKRTQITVMPAGSETALFKQFFSDWKDKDQTIGPGQVASFGRIAKVEQIPFDASSLHSNKAMAAQHAMVDDGTGKVQIWRVEKGDKVPVDPQTYGQFYGGDCYLILYSYNEGGREKHLIYTWQGLKCTQDELAGSAFLTVKLDDSMGGCPVQVRVTQGQEPAHLMSIFKNKPMIIYSGGTCREGGQSQAGSKRLFQIRESTSHHTRAVEVDPEAKNLNTNDVFLLKTPKDLFLWRGEGASDVEMDFAKRVAEVLGGRPTEVREGQEPAGFWTALGGKSSYQTSRALQRIVRAPRLFGCSNKTGRLIAEEVPGDFTQSDLATDDVMLLDTWDQIFIWIGKDANTVEKEGAEKIAQEYLESDPSQRARVPIVQVKQGMEPPTFTGWFHAWDSEMWGTDQLACMQKQL
ncbi:hypothetical protein GJAV_G00120690 [Gymnothorax javanicus]|nr:hypothetical protein GJAV_G00120690 [Gymnothorax javanicus]